ncbi:MAG TPA: MerR family transcriptional regulator [Planctomycetes bacterium]|nr:MerR family transcriptional regulator [Planctomycetota bacterium]
MRRAGTPRPRRRAMCPRPRRTMAKHADTFTIGSLARAAGLPVSTLRYYERRGLLVAEARTESSYRVYGPASLERLRFIRAAQNFGFTLEDIEALVEMDESAGESCASVRGILARRREDVARRIAELERVRDMLAVSMDWCLDSKDGSSCRVLEELRARARGEEGTSVPGIDRGSLGAREVAAELAERLSPLLSDARLFLTAVRLLADGSPVEPSVLALEIDREEGELRTALASIPGVERDDAGRLVGLGLCLAATGQRVLIQGLALYTWGPFEALLLPALLGRRVQVRWEDRAGSFEFTARPDAIEDAGAGDARLVLALPSARDVAADPRGRFSRRCRFVLGDVEPEPGSVVLDLPSAHAVARHLAAILLARAGEAPSFLGG